MRAALVLALVTGCASSYQSARAVPVGKVQVTTAATRGQVSDVDGSEWVGDVQLRTGLTERVDGGIRLVRTPGGVMSSSGFGVDGKVELTPLGSTLTFSLALPASMMWDENGTSFETPVLALVPTLFFGAELSSNFELVLSTKYVALFPNTGERQSLYGGSAGLRVGDDRKSWAVEPEITYLQFDKGGQFDRGGHSILFGLGLSIGN